MNGIRGIFSAHPKISIIAGIVIILVFLFIGFRANGNAGDIAGDEGTDDTSTEEVEDPEEVDNVNGGTDKMLAQLQPDLEAEYGKPPEGFIWDQQGNPISLGIKGMDSEDVVYAYVRAISTLDMGTAQKLSRETSVVEKYADYFSKNNSTTTDYSDQTQKNIYQQTMLSLENKGVSDSSVFAENQRVYTFNASIIDLSDKSFWNDEKDEVLKKIYDADEGQSDSTKAELYVNDYIVKHYKSGNAKKKDITFSLTVQKYPDINSGWVVSIDKELDDELSYKEGTSVAEYIMSQYRDYKQDKSTEGN